MRNEYLLKIVSFSRFTFVTHPLLQSIVTFVVLRGQLRLKGPIGRLGAVLDCMVKVEAGVDLPEVDFPLG